MRADPEALAIRSPNHRSIGAHPRSLVNDLARRSVLAVFGGIASGHIVLLDGDERFTFGRPLAGLSATITLRDPAAYRAILEVPA